MFLGYKSGFTKRLSYDVILIDQRAKDLREKAEETRRRRRTGDACLAVQGGHFYPFSFMVKTRLITEDKLVQRRNREKVNIGTSYGVRCLRQWQTVNFNERAFNWKSKSRMRLNFYADWGNCSSSYMDKWIMRLIYEMGLVRESTVLVWCFRTYRIINKIELSILKSHIRLWMILQFLSNKTVTL